MQTRRLRLGDVVDDYCPRERRLSNHVIVAMVEDAIKQTRCSTCDFEHPYKDGKLPARRKKKDATAALYEQVLEGMTDKPLLAVAAEEPPPARIVEPAAPVVAAAAAAATAPAPAPSATASAAATERPKSANLRSRAPRGKAAAAATAAAAAPASASTQAASTQAAASAAPAPVAAAPVAAPILRPAPTPPPAVIAAAAAAHNASPNQHHAGSNEDVDENDAQPPAGENEPLHRRTLIRATLPRPVGEVPVRQAPTFTIREAARAPKFRRPFARNARPQSGQNGVMNGPPRGQGGPRGPQARGKKGGAQHAQHGAQGGHRFGQGHGSGGHQGAHSKGRQQGQGGHGNKRFK
jgi:hypothetical protein